MAAQGADLFKAVAVDQRHMIPNLQLLLEEVISVLNPEEHPLGAGVIFKAYAADNLAPGYKECGAVRGNPAHGDGPAHIPVEIIPEGDAKPTGGKGPDGIGGLVARQVTLTPAGCLLRDDFTQINRQLSDSIRRARELERSGNALLRVGFLSALSRKDIIRR